MRLIRFVVFTFVMCLVSSVFCVPSESKTISEPAKWSKLYEKIKSYDMVFDSKRVKKNVDLLLNKYDSELPDSVKATISEIQIRNMIRNYQYAKIPDACNSLITKYPAQLDSEELTDYRDKIGMYNAIKNIKPTTMKIRGKGIIPSCRDSVMNVITMPMYINGTKSNFLFDTGADMSVIDEGLAKELGLNIFDTKISVGTGTKPITVKLAVADSIVTGDIIFKNVLMCVIENMDVVSFDNFRIRGVLGENEMRLFDEINIYKNGEIRIPKKLHHKVKNNLYLLGEFAPFVKIKNDGKDLMMFLDTGANTSYIRKKEITDSTNCDSIKTIGAGGEIIHKAYYMDNFKYKINGKEYMLNRIQIQPDAKFDGSIGEDMLIPFDMIIINNKDMFVKFGSE